jgi:hypothetical protein
VIWGLVVLAIGATVAWHIFLSPARLRAMAESSLSAMIEGRVSVHEAQFALERGVVLKGIRIEDPDSKHMRPMVDIETLTLRPHWGPLLRGALVLKGIIVEHPQIILDLDESGHWPFLSRIHPPKGAGGTMPRVDVANGEIEISNLGPEKRIPDMKFSGIAGNFRAWSVNPGAWWSDIDVPGGILGKIHIEIHNSGLNDQVQGNLRLTGIKLGPDIRDLLPPTALPTWDSLEPGGTTDVYASLIWDPAEKPPLQIKGNAQLHAASVKLPTVSASAPTALTNINGRVTFNLKEITAEGVTGTYGEAPFAVKSGFASLEKDGPFELAGSAYGCKVEGLFKDLVPPEGLDQIPESLKEYLLDAKISGKVDGSFKLSRAEGAKEIQSSVEVSARDLTLSHSRLGYPLVLNVSFRYGGDALSFSQASARWGGARIEMPPATFNFAEGAALDFSVRVSDLELDRKLRDLLPASFAKTLDDNGVGGTVDADFHLERAEGAAAPTHWRALVYLRDGRMAYVDFPYPVEHMFGRVEIEDDGLKGAEFSGTNGPSQVGIAMRMGKTAMPLTTFNLGEGAAADFSMHVSNLKLDQKLHDLLPASIAKNLDVNGVGGTVDADFHLERAEGAAAQTHWQALVYLRDGRMRYVDFPYPVEHLFGRVEIEDDGLKGVEFSGMNGPSQIGVTESFDKYKGMPGRLLTIRAMGGVFNQDLRNALPPSCLKLWDSLKPQGTINMNLAIQFYQDPKFPDEKSEFTFDATLPKFSLEAGIPLQLTVGNITIEEAKEDSPGKLFIHGRFNVAQAGFEGVQMAGLRGTFQSRDGLLRLEDIAADCFGGRLTGSLAIRGGADETNLTADEFRGELFLSDASVRDIIQGTDIKGMSGRLNAENTFSGSLSNPDDFRATGAMTIRDGKIGAQPGSVLLSVLNLLQLKKLDEAPFHDVQLEYDIKGSALIAKEFNFVGNLLSLYGSGSMGKDGKQMNLKFRPEFGPRLPRLPLFSRILDVVFGPYNWIKGKVIPIEVSGDYSDPVVRMNPALSLTRFIQSGIAQLVPLDFLKPKEEPAKAPIPAK